MAGLPSMKMAEYLRAGLMMSTVNKKIHPLYHLPVNGCQTSAVLPAAVNGPILISHALSVGSSVGGWLIPIQRCIYFHLGPKEQIGVVKRGNLAFAIRTSMLGFMI